MPKFAVAYRDKGGKTVRARLDGDSRKDLLSSLRAKGAVPISIEQVDANAKTVNKRKAREKSPVADFFQKKVKLDEMAIVFRTLSTMLGGGLPIVDSISDVGAQAENPRLKEVLTSVSSDIREGASLSASMRKHPKVFSKLMIAMVHAGEESGHMGGILGDLADYLDTQVELRRKIKAGIRYPMFILGFFMLAVSALFIFILPRFEDIFAGLGAELPLITRLVMGFSRLLAGNIVYIFLLLAALVIATVVFKRTETGRRFFDRLFLRLPVVGPMVHKVVVARMTRTLGLLLDCGIAVVEALTLTGDISGNYVFQKNLLEIRDNIVRGSTLSEEMDGRRYFPRMLNRMTAAGEATGSLGDMLERVAQHYTREAAVSIDSLMALLEPVLLSLLGVVVAIVILAVYLPIFQLATAMG